MVIDSNITVDVDGLANVSAGVTSTISASFNAESGLGWRKGHGFFPITRFTPGFSAGSQTPSGNARVGADLIPIIDVSIYGIPGSELALKTGLANLSANVSKHPWWTLDAPVDLAGTLTIVPLGLASPSLALYSHSFALAHATTSAPGSGSPNSNGGGPSAPTTPTSPTPPVTTFVGDPGTNAPPSTLGSYDAAVRR